MFWANAEMWTEAVGRPHRAEEYAQTYWKYPAETHGYFKEVLVYGGTVTVKREVAPRESRSPYRVAAAYLRGNPDFE